MNDSRVRILQLLTPFINVLESFAQCFSTALVVFSAADCPLVNTAVCVELCVLSAPPLKHHRSVMAAFQRLMHAVISRLRIWSRGSFRATWQRCGFVNMDPAFVAEAGGYR